MQHVSPVWTAELGAECFGEGRGGRGARPSRRTMFPLDLAAKDLGYIINAALGLGSRVPMLRSVSEAFDEGRAQGLENENLTAIAKLFE
jgi:3-hydroxyisobutyrate dehydrogenase-like beta-hydroxyacid dehydrogenase